MEAQPNSTTMTDADGPVRVEADAAAVASKAREGSPSVDLAKTRDRAVPTGSVSGSASHLEQGGSVSVTDKVDAISSSDNGMIANGKDDIRAASLDDLEASTVSPSSSRYYKYHAKLTHCTRQAGFFPLWGNQVGPHSEQDWRGVSW